PRLSPACPCASPCLPHGPWWRDNSLPACVGLSYAARRLFSLSQLCGAPTGRGEDTRSTCIGKCSGTTASQNSASLPGLTWLDPAIHLSCEEDGPAGDAQSSVDCEF